MENLEPETKILKTESETAAQIRKAECQDPKFHLAVKDTDFLKNQVCLFLSSSLRCLRFVEIKFAFLRIQVCMKRIMQDCVSENSKFH